MRKTLIIFTLLVASAGAVKLFIFSSGDPGDDDMQKEFNRRYAVFGLAMPDSISFAGEEAPIKDRDVSERLDRELLANTYFQSNTMLMHKRANRWFPVIIPILEKHGIPDDFKYMVLAESNLTNAISPAGATGFWQLMEETAKHFGLEINEEIDERYDVEKSTNVACKYLKEAYKQFGSWTLTAASYNIGIEGISRQIERQRTANYYDLYLNEETSRYIFRVLAMKEVLSNPKRYGYHFREKDLYKPLVSKSLIVDTTITDLAEFALIKGANYKILKLFNPWIRKNSLTITEGKKYTIRLPRQDYYTFSRLASELGDSSAVFSNDSVVVDSGFVDE